jgi:hypothetical protein
MRDFKRSLPQKIFILVITGSTAFIFTAAITGLWSAAKDAGAIKPGFRFGTFATIVGVSGLASLVTYGGLMLDEEMRRRAAIAEEEEELARERERMRQYSYPQPYPPSYPPQPPLYPQPDPALAEALNNLQLADVDSLSYTPPQRQPQPQPQLRPPSSKEPTVGLDLDFSHLREQPPSRPPGIRRTSGLVPPRFADEAPQVEPPQSGTTSETEEDFWADSPLGVQPQETNPPKTESKASYLDNLGL